MVRWASSWAHSRYSCILLISNLKKIGSWSCAVSRRKRKGELMALGAKDPREPVGGAQWQSVTIKASPWPGMKKLKRGGRGLSVSSRFYNHRVSRCFGTKMGSGRREAAPGTLSSYSGWVWLLFPALNGWLRRREENHVVWNGCIFYSCYLRQAC